MLSLREENRVPLPALPSETIGWALSRYFLLPSKSGATRPVTPTVRYQSPDSQFDAPSPACATAGARSNKAEAAAIFEKRVILALYAQPAVDGSLAPDTVKFELNQQVGTAGGVAAGRWMQPALAFDVVQLPIAENWNDDPARRFP